MDYTFLRSGFVFLAGTSAFLTGDKMKNKKQLSLWLVKRGVWLIVLEVSLVKLAWMFTLDYSITLLLVIWALGISMTALAALIHLPKYVLLICGIAIIAGHNLLHPVLAGIISGPVWKILYVASGEVKIGDFSFLVGYPLLPWIGLMVLGYSFGQLYIPSFQKEKRFVTLLSLGAGMIVLFLVLRITNTYGDPVTWTVQNSAWFTLLSLFNTTKYPPSLLYICMTLGPALIFLAMGEKKPGWFSKKLIVIGRVPMFYYLTHLYLVHYLAALAALFAGYSWSDMVVHNIWINHEPQLKGYGFGLGMVYVVWLMVLGLLYPACYWYNNYKNKNAHLWWLSYL